MTRIQRWPGRVALMVAHCAGMVDLVALPVWVGTLISRYHLDPQQAGLLVTLFLAGAVLASLVLAPRFNRLRGRWVAAGGFGLAALCFGALSEATELMTMGALHALAGLSAGAALSVTHGTVARSGNPHRLFALVGMALGVFAIVFLGTTPQLVAAAGGAALFRVFGAVMALGALVALLAFPAPEASATLASQGAQGGGSAPGQALGTAVWFGIVGISCMGLVQAMTFSFLERVGHHRGFGMDAITGVLIALGFVNLFPAALAAMLEKRWSAHRVLLVGPVLQALLVLVIMQSVAFAPYAVAASVFAAVMIFTHTFAFGLLARLDASGRAMAATPAMLMAGAAVGPILGGTLVKTQGYGSLGVAAVCIGALAVICFARVRVPAPVGATA